METKNAYELAILAECASPDTLTSPGAEFLEYVQVYANEAIECSEVNEDMASEIADNAPNVYTWTLWQQFTDLAAWQEDIEEFGPTEDLTYVARMALYQIALRLADALLAEAVDDDEEGA